MVGFWVNAAFFILSVNFPLTTQSESDVDEVFCDLAWSILEIDEINETEYRQLLLQFSRTGKFGWIQSFIILLVYLTAYIPLLNLTKHCWQRGTRITSLQISRHKSVFYQHEYSGTACALILHDNILCHKICILNL